MTLQYSEAISPTLPRGGGVHGQQQSYMANELENDFSITGANQNQNQNPIASSDSASQKGSTTSRDSHQCHLCTRVYERADHLNRHMKTHENARPYKCTQCLKRFNRADLLSRHEANHGRIPGKRGEDSDRVSVACRSCVASKCKCQDEKPCVRCRTKGIPCEIGPVVARGEPPKRRPRQNSSKSHDVDSYNGEQATSMNALNESRGSLSNQNESSMSPERENLEPIHPDLGFMQTDSSLPLHFRQNQQSTIGVLAQGDTSYGTLGMGPLTQNNAPQLYSQTFQPFSSMPGDFHFNQGLGFVPKDSYFGQDLDFDMWDINHADFELHLPREVTPPANKPGEQVQQDPEVTNGGHAYRRFAAFEKSPWLWNPTPNDHTLNDQTNLNVDSEGVTLASTPTTPGTQMEQFSSCCIDSKARDRILHLLFNLRISHTSVTSFPPLSLLNIIIQVYFVQCRFNADHMIHAASFDPQTVSPELLIAIISAGANAFSAPTIRRMGLVLQEYVRHTVAELVSSLTAFLQASSDMDNSGNETIVLRAVCKQFKPGS